MLRSLSEDFLCTRFGAVFSFFLFLSSGKIKTYTQFYVLWLLKDIKCDIHCPFFFEKIKQTANQMLSCEKEAKFWKAIWK